MIKKISVKSFLISVFIVACITLSLSSPHQANAVSFGQILSPVASIFTTIREKVEYIFAFTPTGKVKVLENQAQRRLSNAQNQVQNDPSDAENLIKEYQDIKNKQHPLLDKVDDDTFKQIQEQTIAEQKTLVKIGNVSQTMGNVVKDVNTTVVAGVKNIITLKEGTTAGEAFDQKATITYAPGTGPATLIIEGGEQKFAPGTSEGGQGGQTIQGGELQKVVGGTSGTGTTKVEGNNPGVAPGTTSGGRGGTKVEGGNAGVAPGTTSGGTGGQTVVGE